MFARRFRVLLKIRDQMSLSRLLSSNHIEPNLKYSPITARKSTKLNNFSRSFSTQQIERASNSSEEPAVESSSEDTDDEEIDKNSTTTRITENQYAYTYLKNSGRYKRTIIPPIVPDEAIPDDTVDRILAKDWNDLEVSEVLEDFRILSYHSRLNHVKLSDKHAKILDSLISISGKLLDDQLLLVIRYMEMWYPMRLDQRHASFDQLEITLDHECWKRAQEWDANELLMTCDLFYHLRRAKKSKFVLFAMRKLGIKPGKMSAHNYVHWMFLLNACRRPFVNMYELEYRLEKIIHEYTAEELAIIAMGFFKTETPIRNPALSTHIIEKCIANMDTLGEIFVCAVMKVARLSFALNERDIIRRLIRQMVTRVKTISTICLVHAIHTGATTLIYERPAIDLILRELTSRGFKSTRLKDIERTLFSAMMFKWPKDSPLYENAVEELRDPRRTSEWKKFTPTYACSLMYLAHAGVFPMDIINRIMDHGYLREVYRNNAFKLGRQYLFLECSLKIEVPEYQGPFLPKRIYDYLAKKNASPVVWYEDPSERVQTYQKFLFEVIHYLKQIAGENNYIVDQILPHHMRADIFLCLDSDNNFVSPVSMLSECPRFTVKFAPSKEHKWFALVLASHNHLFRHSKETSGAHEAKLRQLEKCGYTPIQVTLQEWKYIEDAKRLDYFRDVLNRYIASNNEKIIA